MEKADLILEMLTSMERAFRAENKLIHEKIDKLSKKVDKLDDKVEIIGGKLDMTWQAVRELRDDKSEINDLRERVQVLEKKTENVG